MTPDPKAAAARCACTRARAVLTGVFFVLSGVSAEAEGASQTEASKAKQSQTGLASYYSKRFEGKKTASGETFRNQDLVAAHRTLPLGSVVRVTNLENDESVTVRITDRGASAENRREGVIIDVSQAAATQLRMKKEGRVKVRVDVLELAVESGEASKRKEPSR